MLKSRDFRCPELPPRKARVFSHLLHVVDNFGQAFFTIVESATAVNPVYSIQSN
jgi:hypothetical protein